MSTHDGDRQSLGRIGLVGFGVMGRGLATNVLRNGGEVVAFDPATSAAAMSSGEAHADDTATGEVELVASLDALALALPQPRTILMMVPAGATVDTVIDALTPTLAAGDVIIDGGNSNPSDTARRVAALAAHGIHLIGAGISGGEEGAVTGPSIMPGGAAEGWPVVAGLLRTMAARDPEGQPCCDWIGPGGAGHLVKTVHNGIEYALMQAIAESVMVLRGEGVTLDALADLLQAWDADVAGGFLLDITADVLRTVDIDGAPLVDQVLDAPAQKGTGGWTVELGLASGQPVTVITAAVLARSLSARREDRIAFTAQASAHAGPAGVRDTIDPADVHAALRAASVLAFVQGLDLLAATAHREGYTIDLGRVASLWRAGSIVRTRLLDTLRVAADEAVLERGEASDDASGTRSLLLSPSIATLVTEALPGLRRTVATAVMRGVAVPVLAATIATIDTLRTTQGSGSIIQAQRDRFGAHRFERVDRPRGEHFHAEWRG